MLPWYLILLLALAVLTVPFALGYVLARSFKLPDHGWKIGLVLSTISASVLVTVLGWPPQLGIDLRGGVILVYDILAQDSEDQEDERALGGAQMDRLIQAISKRIDPSGIQEISIRPYSAEQIEVIIPEADEDRVRRIERNISRAGTLEFRILANRGDNRHDDVIAAATRSAAREVRIGDQVRGRWVPMFEDAQRQFVPDQTFVTRQNVRGEYEILVIIDTWNVNGGYLQSVSEGFDQRGDRSVNFRFDSVGARRFGRLTGDNIPRNDGRLLSFLGIVLDGSLYSAPRINSAIFERGEITGRFSKEEIEDLVAVLRAGSLPASLSERPVSKQFVGPTLGADTVQKGQYAMIVSMIAVLIFMIAYYRFAGVVAAFALVANLVLILAVMITFKAAFSLPGLAGLVLTVGMAVDANVLIFERIREELNKGATLRMAIRNGFGRATTTIVDANLTTLITATVLYVIGTDQVRGFAITLWLGIIASMYTAIFCSRVIFDIAERNRWVTRLSMASILGHTQINFLSLKWPAIAVSMVLIAIGLGGVVHRGKNLLNIDFTGGAKVEIVFNEPHQVGAVRAQLADQRETLPDVVVVDRQITGEPAGLRFAVSTSNDDEQVVQETLRDVFGDQLATNHLRITSLAMISPDVSGGATEEPPATAPDNSTAPNESATPEDGAASEDGATAEDGATSEDGATPEDGAASEDGATAEDAGEPDAADGAAMGAPYSAGQRARGADVPARLLAFAGSDATLLALAQEDDAPEPAAEGDDEPADAGAPTEPDPSSQADDTIDDTSPAAVDETSPAAASATPGPGRPAADDVPPGETSQSDALGLPGAASVLENPYAGGSRAELTFDVAVSPDTVRERIQTQLDRLGHSAAVFEVQKLEGEPEGAEPAARWEVLVSLPPEPAQEVLEAVGGDLVDEPFFPEATKFGGKVAAATRQQAIYAVLASLIFIVAYIWIRFERVAFGLAAVVALVHDVLITLGALALSAYVADYLGFLLIDPFKIDLPIVAAFLTIIGYSLNDTIVIFDRIREVRGKSPQLTEDMVNRSVNQTLSRTILTTLTTLIVVLILYVAGGEGIHGFTFALLVGMIAGTYSTIFIASPVLLWLSGMRAPKQAAVTAGGASAQPSAVR